MTVSLLELSEGGCSLEFEPEDLPAVKAAIHALFGKVRIESHVITSTVRFGGEDFTFQNEWDDPCLITSTAAGEAMLRRLAERLS